MNRLPTLAVLITLVASATTAPAQQWTRFRGPNGSGSVEVSTLPKKWTNEDYNWKIKLPGVGHSSPVVWGNRVFLISADPKTARRYVLCVNAENGRKLWTKEYSSATHRLHRFSSYASCTPAVDADRVYIAWSTPTKTTMMALDHDGNEKWVKDLGTWQSQHGYGTSPMFYKDLVIVNNSQQANQLRAGETAGESYVIAFDRKTGAERWRRKGKSSNVAYSVPCIYERNGKAELICCNSTEGMFSLDPATGKQNWLLPVFKRRTVSSPYVVGDLVFGSTGSGGGGNYLVAVRPGEKPEVAYQIEQAAPYVPSSIAYKDMAFLFSDGKIGGVLTCIDSKTGEVHFKKRLGAAFFGCPVRAGNTIYCVDEEGMCYVLDAAKNYKLHSKIDLGEACRSTPAISGGRLFLRTQSQLMCLGSKSL